MSVKKEVSAAETESGVKEESARPQKKARKEVRKEASVDASKVPSTEARSEASTSVGGMTNEQIKKSFMNITDAMMDGFGMCLKEIKFLEDRMQRTKDAAMVHVHGKSDQARKLAASQQSPIKGNNTAKVIIPNKRVGHGYDHFSPFDKKMSKVFTDWVKLDTCFKTPMDKKPRRFPSRFYHTLRTPIEWLNDGVSLLLCLLVSHLPVVMSSLEDLTDNLPISLLLCLLEKTYQTTYG
ncbi:hypothetical protein F2Q70_00042514 [Brassica cretica]|uniref:Uncharacterized protein n=1 Tax=Brassica cretica TaxID=69181 RepID=A0A8S9KEZ2_BRACR|nr:hypothetical protein F2Q70_00042514 [Brassica cretica]